MKHQSLIVFLTLVLAATSSYAAEPIDLQFDPQYFSIASEPGTFRTSVRWGEIKVEGHDGPEVRVRARIVLPQDSEISTREIEDLVDLRIDESDNVMELRVSSDLEGFYGVELDVAVPHTTRIELEMTGGGEVVVSDIAGEVDVANRNGSVRLNGLGSSAVVDARNGSVTAVFDRVDDQLPMSFSTLNGSIDVTLPDNVSADARIRHTYGGVESDFEFTAADGRPASADIEGLTKGTTRVLSAKINGGGPRYDFSTANGTIYLRRQGTVAN